MKKFAFALVLALSVAVAASALDLGDQAPPLSPDKWVSGQPIAFADAKEGDFFLIEVWSTTCPLCLRSIPLLNDLQKRYADKGLKIVSFTTDTAEEVEPFLIDHPMDYASFIDKEGATFINYMAADNRNTIPQAFLFDKTGTLVWIGNPLDNVESRVKQVLDGTLNGEHALAIRDARNKLQSAFEGQDAQGMLAALTTLQDLEPDNVQYYQLQLRILSQFGGEDAAVDELFKKWYNGCKDHADSLIMLSVMAMEQMQPSHRDPELALKAAKRAYNLDSDVKLEAGLTLAETYKDLGRVDLSLKMLDELKKMTEDPQEQEILNEIAQYYQQLQTLGQNPDSVAP